MNDKAWFERVVGGFPKIESAKVKVKSDFDFLKAEFEGDLTFGATGSIPISTIVDHLDKHLVSLKLKKSIYLFADELEVFYHEADQYARDLRLVRDIIFTVDHFATLIRRASLPIAVCAGIRSEVLDALGSKGQEVTRIAHDRGGNIAWHSYNRGLSHPLFNMLRRKIWASEVSHGLQMCSDPIAQYFAPTVQGVELDVFLLDQSFYKPRDLIWRLSLAKDHFPERRMFDGIVLSKTESEYSSKLWDEVMYELSASYSDDEVKVIEGLFLGKRAYFELDDVFELLQAKANTLHAAEKLQRRRGVREILCDLYRIGAIGNSFKVGSKRLNRWHFRGDSTLLEDKAMEIHPALVRRLSVTHGRASRRGSAAA